MKLSFNWLKEYVELDDSITAAMVADKLSTSGFEIEEFFNVGCDIDGVVIGKVLECEKHPNADKLNVCKVDIKTEHLQIVCGAPNVAKGQIVPVAKVGTILSEGFVIKSSNLRGTDSNGMICSEAELNLSNESDGIMVLDAEAKIGEPFSTYFSDNDIVFDLSITPNRPDCLSHLGIAKELSVMFDCQFKDNYKEKNKIGKSGINVKIDEDSCCERYTASVIKNVHIGPSPKWLVDRLNAIGLRSINNLVDISNYIMFDIGQPMHFYDLDQISNHTIHIRKANKDDVVETLDSKERKLTGIETVIYDDSKFAGLAGVIGGKDTEITTNTTNVLIEAAIWNQVSIQKIQRDQNILTDASYRYSKGVDHNLPIRAQNNAISMILDLCSGTLEGEILDLEKFSVKPHTVSFREDRCNRVLGTVIDTKHIKYIFNALGFKELNKNEWLIPTHRQDISREIDLIEEVARIVGLENIPAKTQTVVDYAVDSTFELDKIDEIKDFLINNGVYEINTLSMVNVDTQKPFSRKVPVEIINPLSDEMNAMRLSLIPSILKVVEYNLNRQNANIALFEVNKDYFAKKKNAVETRKLVLAITGLNSNNHWDKKPSKSDFYDIKGFAESLLEKIGLESYNFISSDLNFLSAESLKIEFKNNPLGFFGEVDKSIMKSYKISQKVYVLELNLDAIFSIVKPKIKTVSDISKHPIVERDIAVIIDSSIKSSDMINEIKNYCGEILNSIEIVDKYENKKIHAVNEYSLAFRMYLQADHTLTDEQIEPIFKGSIDVLAKKFNARLRDN